MCDPVSISAAAMVASTGLSIYSGIQSANGQRAAGAANQKYYYYLAGLSEEEAAKAQEQSARDQTTIDIASKGVRSSQRAVMAANGVGGGSVTAEDLLRDTFNTAELDKMAVRYNADSISNSKYAEAKGYRMAGANTLQAANINADTTLLTTASSVASRWLEYGSAAGWGRKAKVPAKAGKV